MELDGKYVMIGVLIMMLFALSVVMVTTETESVENYPTYTYNKTTGVYCNLMTTLCYSIALENVDPFHNIGVSMMFPNEDK
jgi:surface polysaccharide O-acyltransferase-like enzyme